MMSEISRLLDISLRAHQDAKRARLSGRMADGLAHWQNALNARTEAHQLDPDHLDDAWGAEQDKSPRGRDTHHELMAFYAERGLTAWTQPAPVVPVVPETLSIQEIAAKVQPSAGQDVAMSDAFALLLVESGWLTLDDLSESARQRSPFDRLIKQAESTKTGPEMRMTTPVEPPVA